MDAIHQVKLVVDVALIHEGKVLLTRYRDPDAYDGQKGLFLPNDLLRDREDPEDAAARVIAAQLGVSNLPLDLAFAESFTGRDRSWHLALHYFVRCNEIPSLKVSSQLAEPAWFDLDALPPRSDVAHGGWALQTIARIHSM